jgi:hypothetical protein
MLYTIRRALTVTTLALSAGGFWGYLAAVGAKLALDLTEEQALLYVGLPVALMLAVWLWPKLPRALGFDD